MSHVKQPKICDACIAKISEMSKAIQDHSYNPIWKYCKFNSTVAIALHQDGVIQQWHLIGPLSVEEAKQRMADVDFDATAILEMKNSLKKS